MTDKLNEQSGVLLQGHIKIHNPETGEVIVDKRNAIHYENMSISLAESLGNAGTGWIYQMGFGNGGTSVDPTGIITYLTPNSTGTNASLYNETFTKVVDDKCGVCKKGHSNPPNEIIYCDGEGCNYAVHQHCIAPVPLLIIPEEEWYCQICLPSFNTMMDVTDNNNNDSNNNSSSSSSSSNNISNNNNSNNNNISNCNNDNSNSTGQTSTPTNRTTGAKTQNSNSTSRKGGNNNNNTRINTTNNNNYHNSKQKTTRETPQNTQSTGKSPVGESSVGESSVGELTAAEKIIQKEPAKNHSVLTTTNNKEFDKPDGTVCPPLRRSKRLQENLNKDTDSDISA